MVRIPSKLEQRIIRAFTYSETGGSTPIMPFLNQLENIITTSLGTASAVLSGLDYGITAGLISGFVTIMVILFVIKLLKLAIGWLDLHVMGWTAYKIHWFSGLAPGRVLILNNEGGKDGKEKEEIKQQAV